MQNCLKQSSKIFVCLLLVVVTAMATGSDLRRQSLGTDKEKPTEVVFFSIAKVLETMTKSLEGNEGPALRLIQEHMGVEKQRAKELYVMFINALEQRRYGATQNTYDALCGSSPPQGRQVAASKNVVADINAAFSAGVYNRTRLNLTEREDVALENWIQKKQSSVGMYVQDHSKTDASKTPQQIEAERVQTCDRLYSKGARQK